MTNPFVEKYKAELSGEYKDIEETVAQVRSWAKFRNIIQITI